MRASSLNGDHHNFDLFTAEAKVRVDGIVANAMRDEARGHQAR